MLMRQADRMDAPGAHADLRQPAFGFPAAQPDINQHVRLVRSHINTVGRAPAGQHTYPQRHGRFLLFPTAVHYLLENAPKMRIIYRI